MSLVLPDFTGKFFCHSEKNAVRGSAQIVIVRVQFRNGEPAVRVRGTA